MPTDRSHTPLRTSFTVPRNGMSPFFGRRPLGTRGAGGMRHENANVTQKKNSNISGSGEAFHDSDSLAERLDGRALALMKPLKRRLWKPERSYG